MDFAFKGLKGFAAEAATALNRAKQVSFGHNIDAGALIDLQREHLKVQALII